MTLQFTPAGRSERGYAMAVLLVGIAIMGVMLTVAMPVWHQTMQREKEEELIFRGRQYARAVGLFQRKFAGGYPPSIDVLVQQKFLRKKYKDPMVPDGQFQLIPAGAMQAGQVGASLPPGGSTQAGRSVMGGSQSPFTARDTSPSGQTVVAGGIVGVVSKSKDKSIKLYNGRDHYNEWLFVYSAQTGRGVPQGGPGRGGRGGPQGPYGPGVGGTGGPYTPGQGQPPGRGQGPGGQ